jgi:integrase
MNTATTHKLHNLTARRKLAARAKPYFVSIAPKLTLGYLSRPGQAVGSWVARREIGRKETKPGTKQYAYPTYQQWAVGAADDLVPADGATVLSFQQAMTRAATEHHAKQTGTTSTVVTVRDAVRQYLTFIEGRKGERARTDAESKLGKHVLKHPIADRKVNDLASEELEQWQAGLVTTTKGPERIRRSQDTANRILASFKATLNRAWGTKANRILSDHAWRKLKRFRQVAQCRVHHFSMDEVRHLLASAHPPAFRDLLEAAFLIGARYGELAALNVGHLDAGRSHLLIPSGKTGSRLVTLTPEGVGFFVGLVRGRSAEAPLILAPSGQRWTEGRQKIYMTRALTAAGLHQLDTLGRPPTFYAMRHTHISRLRKGGAPDFLIAKNVGTSPAMIERTYGKLTDDERRDMLTQFMPRLREAPHAVA